MKENLCICGQLVANDTDRNEHILSHFEQKHCICCANHLIFVAGKWYQPHVDSNCIAVKYEAEIDSYMDAQSQDAENCYTNMIEMAELSLQHTPDEVKQEATTNTASDSAIEDPLAEIYQCEHCPKKYTSRAYYLEHTRFHRLQKPAIETEKSLKIHIQASSEMNIAECDPLAIFEHNVESEQVGAIKNIGYMSRISSFQPATNLLGKTANSFLTVDKYQSKLSYQTQPSAAKKRLRSSRNPSLYRLIKPSPATTTSSETKQTASIDSGESTESQPPSQEKMRLYACPYCTSKFVQRSSAFRHIKQYHPDKVPDPRRQAIPPPNSAKPLENHRLSEPIPNEGSKGRIFRCALCSMRFMQSSCAYRHMREVHGREAKDYLMEAPFTCSECPSRFANRESALEHKRDAHKIVESPTPKPKVPRLRKRRYICDYCGQMFKMLSALRHHINIHTDSRPFKCDICEKSFRRPDTLAAHRHIHTEKPSKCNFESCGRAFIRQGDLYRHRFKAHGISRQKFPCTICEIDFPENSQLRKHLKSHDTT